MSHCLLPSVRHQSVFHQTSTCIYEYCAIPATHKVFLIPEQTTCHCLSFVFPSSGGWWDVCNLAVLSGSGWRWWPFTPLENFGRQKRKPEKWTLIAEVPAALQRWYSSSQAITGLLWKSVFTTVFIETCFWTPSCASWVQTTHDYRLSASVWWAKFCLLLRVCCSQFKHLSCPPRLTTWTCILIQFEWTVRYRCDFHYGFRYNFGVLH
jgi:hypothetical protein